MFLISKSNYNSTHILTFGRRKKKKKKKRFKSFKKKKKKEKEREI